MKQILYTLLCTLFPVIISASEFVQVTEFDKAQSEIKYSLLQSTIETQKNLDSESDEISYNEGSATNKPIEYKSPGKAFAMSLLVPGWGQYYAGESKLKSFAFLGVEVASWVFYFKLHSDADDLTDAYEQFNQAHWIEARYDSMRVWTYESGSDPGPFPELSHTLPDTKTQQYYEMTGKYDQFVWGWEDATLNDSTFEDYSALNPFPRVIGSGVPQSAYRTTYETMRDDANNKYDQARKMIYVSMLNRMISAFEAMISAKKNNNKSTGGLLSSLSAEASYKSFYVKRDTPFLTLKMKF